MNKKNLIRFVQSLVLLPTMAATLTGGSMQNGQITQNVLAKKFNIESIGALSSNQDSASVEELAKIREAKATAIDAYFAKYDMPLEGNGAKMVEEAEKNDLDWRLLPAIAVRESTGGKLSCFKSKNNPFGWNSCKTGFKSVGAGIETVARNLGGNNPKTKMHYENKTTAEILNAYNPPAIVPRYTPQVINIMNSIGEADLKISQDVAIVTS